MLGARPSRTACVLALALPLAWAHAARGDEATTAAHGEADSEGAAKPVTYRLERVEILGNKRTKASLVQQYLPLRIGESFDVSDPEIDAFRYHLLGTGWFDRVELRLERGRLPGWVVLIVQVEERRTFVFQQLAAGVGWSVESVNPRKGPDTTPGREAEPYLGLALAETNFLGTGKTVAGQVLVARDQGGFALGYQDPVAPTSPWGFRTRLTFAKGYEYFGSDDKVNVSVDCSSEELGEERAARCEVHPPAAVVEYYRIGLSLGTARDIGAFTRVSLDYRGELVQVPPDGMPVAASALRGKSGEEQSAAPIDFSIEPGFSFASLISIDFTFDKRDSAILPSRGVLANFGGDLASALIGSDYDFVRLQASIHRWFTLGWGHTIRVGAFGGALFGRAPFFYKFFVSDLTDLQPSRILGLNLDHRPAPNLFGLGCGLFDQSCGTAVAQMRQEELAARADIEYAWPFARGRKKFLKGGDAFFLAGLYGVADPQDLRVAVPGYEGLARLPIDITLDAGVRLDTEIGVFQIGLAKLFVLPVR